MTALTDSIVMNYVLHEVEYNKKYKIHDNWYIETYRVDHIPNSVGYGIIEIREKLKSIHFNLSGTEVREKQLDDDDMFYYIEIHHLLYTGDTTTESFYMNFNVWKKYKNILTECTCVFDPPNVALSRNHNCFANIQELVEIYQGTVFYLCHFSSRYTKNDLAHLVSNNIKICM